MQLVIDDLDSLKLAQATASTARISSSIELATVLQSEIIISRVFFFFLLGGAAQAIKILVLSGRTTPLKSSI